MKRAQSGFILITVLATLVLLALVAARLDDRVGAYREGQGGWQRWTEGQIALAAARDEVLYTMATRQLSQRGFGLGQQAVRVDGRPYRLPSGARVSIQDMRGLIGIGAPDKKVLRKFLTARGVPDAGVDPLIDKLEDYADTNDLARINGAEADDYRSARLAPPRNDWPLSAYELRLVAGWAEQPQLWSDAGDVFTASREPWVNPNTAPPVVLMALPGARPDGVAKVLEMREKRLFTGAAELRAATGIDVPDEPVAFFPGRYYRVRLWQEDGLGALEYTVILTPAAQRSPWLILETRLVDRPEARDAERAIAAFPGSIASTDRSAH